MTHCTSADPRADDAASKGLIPTMEATFEVWGVPSQSTKYALSDTTEYPGWCVVVVVIVFFYCLCQHVFLLVASVWFPR